MDSLFNPKITPALKGILLISLLAALFGSVFSFLYNEPDLLLLFVFLSVVFAGSIWLLRKKLHVAAVTISLFAGIIGISIFSILGKGLHDPIVIFFPAIIIFSSLIFRNDVVIAITFVVLFFFNCAAFLNWDFFPPEFVEEGFTISEFIFYNAAFIAFGIVGKLLYFTISTKEKSIFSRTLLSRAAEKNKSITVAIVEDNLDVLSLLKEEFVEHGYTVIAVDSAEALQEWIEKNGTNIQLIITDFYLKMSDGRMVIENTRRMIPHIPIILVSGYPLEELGVNIEFYNDVEFVPKPFTPRVILAKAEEMLHY